VTQNTIAGRRTVRFTYLRIAYEPGQLLTDLRTLVSA
jgi:hypothetical protein